MASSLYQQLTGEEVSSVLRAALHTGVRAYHVLNGGLFNTTYLVDTEDCGRVVLRMGPVNCHLLMPFEHRLMESEAQVYALCAARGIPVSDVLALDVSRRYIDRDYMIVRYISATSMYEMELEPEDNRRICRDIGAAVAAMHTIPAARFGRVAEAEEGKGFACWSECLQEELRQWESVAVPTGLYDDELLRRTETIFATATSLLDEIREPAWCMSIYGRAIC